MVLTETHYRVRPAQATDRAALVAMLARCTDETRFRRFLGNVRAFPERYLAEATGEVPEHVALVVESGADLVALASCRMVDAHTAELAVLVEDDHQGRGLGDWLLGALVQRADRSGVTILRASLLASQGWLLRLLRRYGQCGARWSGATVDVTVCRKGLSS